MSNKLLMFAHEIAAVTASTGKGIALLQDGIDGMDTVHFHLHTDWLPAHAGHARLLPVAWQRGPIPPELDAHRHQADAAKPGAVLVFDDSVQPMRAAALIRTAEQSIFDTVEIVATGSDSFTRNTPILESQLLRERCVLCIGLGSGGAPVVSDLARAGIGKFILWDPDRLEAHNIGRHICTLDDLGRLKVNAVRDRLLAINPQIQAQGVADDILRHSTADGLLAQSIAQSDVVIAATDNNASRFLINDMAWKMGKIALYGRAFQRACGGDVIEVDPNRSTPCYACHVSRRVVAEEIASSRDAARVAYSDKPVPIEPGLHVDIAPIANMIARLTLLRLAAVAGSRLAATGTELQGPVYLWANRRENQFANWRAMQRNFREMSILRWYSIGASPDPECLVCSARLEHNHL